MASLNTLLSFCNLIAVIIFHIRCVLTWPLTDAIEQGVIFGVKYLTFPLTAESQCDVILHIFFTLMKLDASFCLLFDKPIGK